MAGRKRARPVDRDEPLAVTYAFMDDIGTETRDAEDAAARERWSQMHREHGSEPPSDAMQPEGHIPTLDELRARLAAEEEADAPMHEQYMDDALQCIAGSPDSTCASSLAIVRDALRAVGRNLQARLQQGAPSEDVAFLLAHLAENPDLRVDYVAGEEHEALWPDASQLDASLVVTLRPLSLSAQLTHEQALLVRAAHCTYHWESYARAALLRRDESALDGLRATLRSASEFSSNEGG